MACPMTPTESHPFEMDNSGVEILAFTDRHGPIRKVEKVDDNTPAIVKRS
jgi:hypothetical protein